MYIYYLYHIYILLISYVYTTYIRCIYYLFHMYILLISHYIYIYYLYHIYIYTTYIMCFLVSVRRGRPRVMPQMLRTPSNCGICPWRSVASTPLLHPIADIETQGSKSHNVHVYATKSSLCSSSTCV